MDKCFIDTNVLTDWLIINSEIEKKSSKEEKIEYLKTFKTVREVSLFSYLLLEILKSNENIKNHEFFTSTLAMAELISNIHERYIAEDLFRKHIPIKYLQKVKWDYDVKEDYEKDIKKFIAEFIQVNKLVLREAIDLPSILHLISRKKLDTHDSCLISQAVCEKCNFFITSDGRLKDMLKDFTKLKIIQSNEIYSKIKNIVETPTII